LYNKQKQQDAAKKDGGHPTTGMQYKKQHSLLLHPSNSRSNNFLEAISYERVSVNENNDRSNERTRIAQGANLMLDEANRRNSLADSRMQQLHQS